MEQFQDVFAMYERMFMDEDKDVVFKLADGEERAHRCVLKASSDVFASMFQQDMREKSEGVVHLPEIKRIAMRVFLRLIYTGHVDSSDWGGERDTAQSVCKVLRQHKMTCNLPSLMSVGGSDWGSAVLLDVDRRTFEFSIRAADWTGNLMIGIAPIDTVLGSAIYTTHGFYGYVASNKLHFLYGQDGTTSKRISDLPDFQPNSILSVRFDSSSAALQFSVNSCPWVPAQFDSSIPADVHYCPAINFLQAGKTLEVTSPPSVSSRCTLEVLLATAVLGKKYMVKSVMSMTTQAIKSRLAEAKEQESIETFQQVLVAIIAADMGALRMAALDCAKDFHKLRAEFDEDKLKPEVSYELEAIWPSPACRSLKRARLTCLT